MAAEPPHASNRRFHSILGALLVVALALRLALIIHMGPRYYFADTGEYAEAARSILAGHGPGPAFPRAPLYPALMAVGFALFGEGNYPGVRVLELLLGLSVVALTMLLGYRLGGQRGAVLAGGAAAVAPTLVFTSAMLYPTSLYSALLLAFTLVARGLVVRPGLARGVLLGFFGFLAWMTDQVVLAPVLATVAWLTWAARDAGRRLMGAIALAILTAVLLAAPWVQYHQKTYGNSAFFMEKAQIVLYFVRSDPTVAGSRAVRDTTTRFRALPTIQFVQKEWGLLRQQPVAYLTDYVDEFVHFFKPMPDRIRTQNAYTSGPSKLVAALFFLPVLLFGCVGALFGKAPARERTLLALVPLATAAFYALFFTQTRYRVPTEPHMLVLAALGFGRLFPHLAATLAGEQPPRLGALPPAPVASPASGRNAAAAGGRVE